MSLFPIPAQSQPLITDMGSVLKLIGRASDTVGAIEMVVALVNLQNCFNQPVELYQLKDDGSFTTQISRDTTKAALVLIHGTQELNAGGCLRPFETTWKDTGGSKFLNRFLGDNELKSKFQVFSVHYNSFNPIYKTNGPDVARLLRTKLPQTPLVVLAHSMGGLIARSALSPPPFDQDGAADIRGLVTLATPHEGAPLASREAAEVLKALRPAALSAVVLAGLGKEVEFSLFLTSILSLTIDGPSQGLRDAAFDSVGFTDYNGNPGNPELAALRQREATNQLYGRQIAFAGKFDSLDFVDAIVRDLNFGLDNDLIVPVTSARSTRVNAQGNLFPGANHISILDMRTNPAVFDAVRSALLSFLPLAPPPPPTFTLTVGKQGPGTGTVTSSVGGINCGTICTSQPINEGASVVLTAVPGNGSTFTGWSGGGCSGTGFCTVTMTANQNVTATFNLLSPPPSVQITSAPTGSLNTSRAQHAATILFNGKVLVVGGTHNDGLSQSILPSAELYDPATGVWSTINSLKTQRYDHTATLLQNGKVLVVGGISGSGILTSAELYDPATGLWSTTDSLKTGRSGHTATLLLNGKVLVAGGSSAELYDPATGLWSTTDSLKAERGLHTATLLSNGKVLVVGGDFPLTKPVNNAEVYDPAANNGTGAWITIPGPRVDRRSHTATLLPNGMVLAVGGTGVGFFIAPEVYDPATGVWSGARSNSILSPYSHTATRLSSGQVVVAGGYGDFGVTMSNAELFQ